MLDQDLGVDPAQIEALAARQHGDRHLADLGRREDELDVRRRLLKRLQQRVEGLLRQHMHFVDDIDLVARGPWRIAHALDQLADIVDAGARRRVHLHHVDMAVGGNGDAVVANPTRRDRRTALAIRAQAVQRPGDDARGRGLTHPTHAGQHEGVGDAVLGEGVGEGADQRILADQLGESRRAVFARQYPVGRGRLGGSQPFRLGWGREKAIAVDIAQPLVPPRMRMATRRPAKFGVGGWNNDPNRNSLRLLPLGPDRVGEESVHRQPPGCIISGLWGPGARGGEQSVSKGLAIVREDRGRRGGFGRSMEAAGRRCRR